MLAWARGLDQDDLEVGHPEHVGGCWQGTDAGRRERQAEVIGPRWSRQVDRQGDVGRRGPPRWQPVGGGPRVGEGGGPPHAFQGLDDRGHGRIPVLGPLGRHPPVEHVQLVGDVGPGFGERRDGGVTMLQQQGHERAGRVGGAVRQQEEQRVAQAVDVDPVVDGRRIQGLFGRHVVGGAENTAGLRQRSVQAAYLGGEARQPEVGHLDQASRITQQVRGLDVAVHDAVVVGIREPAGGLEDRLHGVRRGERPSVRDLTAEVPSVDEFHHEEQAGFGLAGVEGHDDVRVSELGDRLDLALETLGVGALTGGFTCQDLECDDPLHTAVAGLEHGAHAAGSQTIDDQVVADTQIAQSALENGVGLKGRQPAGPDQVVCERCRIRDFGGATEPLERGAADRPARGSRSRSHSERIPLGRRSRTLTCSSIGFSVC